MTKATMKNLHVPLPGPLYERLHAEAKRAQRPATALARDAIDEWLAERQRNAMHDAIVAYAQAAAGTSDDLDRSLEAAAVEHLLAQPDEPGKDNDA